MMATPLLAKSYSLRGLLTWCSTPLLCALGPGLDGGRVLAAFLEKTYRKMEMDPPLLTSNDYIYHLFSRQNDFELSRSRLFYFVTSNCSRVTVRPEFLLERA